MVVQHCYCVLLSFLSYFFVVVEFYSYIRESYWSENVCIAFVWFWHWINGGLIYELGRAPASSVFWERLFRFGFVSSFSVCWNLPVKSCEAELVFFFVFFFSCLLCSFFSHLFVCFGLLGKFFFLY